MAAEITQYDQPRNTFLLEGIPSTLQEQASIELATILSRPENYQDREYVRGLTIDPVGSRDRDDAIWVTKQPDGRHIVDVTIADVAEYIREKRALDAIARLKGFSQYDDFGLVDSLFPTQLNEERFSLLQGKPRLTMTVRMILSPATELQSVRIFPSYTISPRDFTYAEATHIRTDQNAEFHEMLCIADRLAGKLHAKFNGTTEEKHTRRNKTANVGEGHMHHVVGEFMLLANYAIASFAFENGIPILYRNHKPDKNGELNTHAYYSDIPEGHAATGLPFYAHVTSPIRRYADVFAWRMLKQFLQGTGVNDSTARRAPRVARRINQRAMSLGMLEAS